uniref:Nurim n=1 Tax=Naja naja TaxID=35670 RepID=A0A8C6V9T5_NAJNA
MQPGLIALGGALGGDISLRTTKIFSWTTSGHRLTGWRPLVCRWKTALRDPKILHSLTVDVGLIVLFVLQHSLMASDRVKHWTCNCFGVLQRTVYVFCTDLSLQVYYYCLGMGDPLAVKSSRALRLYSHLRHPLYVEFLLILWAVPCLSIDRLLLASLFTVYLTCAHSLDEQDYLYLRAQLDKKFQIFSREEAQEVG